MNDFCLQSNRANVKILYSAAVNCKVKVCNLILSTHALQLLEHRVQETHLRSHKINLHLSPCVQLSIVIEDGEKRAMSNTDK